MKQIFTYAYQNGKFVECLNSCFRSFISDQIPIGQECAWLPGSEGNHGQT